MRRYVAATCVLFAALAIVFFTQDPIEARHRPWRGPHVSEDGWYYYHYLRSAVLDGDLDLDDDYREIGNWYGFGFTSTGHRHNPFGVGPALFWAPGFLLGHAVATAAASTHPDSVPDGMSHAEQGGALFTSFLAALGAFWLSFALCRRYVNDRLAWLGTALAFLASPLVWYAVFSPAMPHALEACFGSVFLWTLLPLRERTTKEAFLLGAALGAMALCRPQLAVFGAIPAFELARSVLRARRLERSLVKPLVRFGCILGVALLVFSPQLYAWKSIYGKFLIVPQGSGFLRFGESMWSETLFSSRNGLFTTTPVLWLLLPGFYLVLKRDRSLGAVLLALFAIQTFVNGAVWDWWGGGAFGGRRFLATFPVWAITLSVLLSWVTNRNGARRLYVGVAGASAAFFLAFQWRMLSAHHAHAFSWETSVPFDERVRIATGRNWPGYRVTGNPFALPMNLVFAVQHGVPLGRYDRAVGPYLLDERVPTTNPLLPWKRNETVRLSDAWALALIGRGFRHSPAGASLDRGTGELFVPLNRPGALTLELGLKAGVPPALAWSFNGEPLTRDEGSSASSPRFRVDGSWVKRGINVLRVDTADAGVSIQTLTLTESPDWPPPWARAYLPERR